MKIALLSSHLLLLCLLSYIVAGQEHVQILTLHHDSTPSTIQEISQNVVPLGVSVNQENLNEVSSTILMAEKWVRTHVLSHYPSTHISTIVVQPKLLCHKHNEQQDRENLKLVLPSMNNLHHSLTRWGLHTEIKVSVSLSPTCFHQDFTQSYISPILTFLQHINSTYSLYPPHETFRFVDFHSKLGFVHMNKLNLIIPISKPTSRRLSFVESMPALPTEIAPTPSHSHHGATSPLPPLIGITAPQMPPLEGPTSPPPYPFNLPPCNPYTGGGGGGATAEPPAVEGSHERLWCVAKPSVPSDELQEGMDYACGEGGADCEAIGPNGSCYSPDSIVAHASYAFNSYWQKNKKLGGTCGFGGTAMLINSDPSFLHCRFVLS